MKSNSEDESTCIRGELDVNVKVYGTWAEDGITSVSGNTSYEERLFQLCCLIYAVECSEPLTFISTRAVRFVSPTGTLMYLDTVRHLPDQPAGSDRLCWICAPRVEGVTTLTEVRSLLVVCSAPLLLTTSI
jgi:hypothetical protein